MLLLVADVKLPAIIRAIDWMFVEPGPYVAGCQRSGVGGTMGLDEEKEDRGVAYTSLNEDWNQAPRLAANAFLRVRDYDPIPF
jgi:hypothetical protein